MSTHIESKLEDISSVVLMPGDPKRCEYIARKFLANSKIVNNVRGMTAYTGFYKSKKITVFPSGMGCPSMGIYSYELFKEYNVDTIIRIGSCGAYTEDLNIFDTILIDRTYTEGNFAKALNGKNEHIASADFNTNNIIEETAKEINIPYVKGNTLCSECFDYYVESIDDLIARFPKDLNIIGAEMEAFALFYTAKYLNKKAACLLTVVDSHYKKQEISSEEREKSLNDMILLALESSLKIN